MQTELYAVVPEENLRSVLSTLYEFVELSLRLMDSNGKILQYYGKKASYCALLQKNFFTHNECDELHFKAGQRAQKLGEAYIFTCHADLNHIAFPLIYQEELLGVVVVGPFLMDEPDSTVVGAMAENHEIPPVLCLELYDELSGLQVIEPAKVKHLMM